jgi:aarF domain-containing kinase
MPFSYHNNKNKFQSLLKKRSTKILLTTTTLGLATTTTTITYTNNNNTTNNNILSLSIIRGTRAIITWLQLVVNYKILSLYRPGPQASGEEKKEYESRKEKTHLKCAQAVLKLCQQNGGLFIKMGQHATSLRPAIPETYIDILRVLQSAAPQKPLHDVVQTIRDEILNSDIAEEMILGIDPKPLGSASLAQVHSCTLPSTGQTVAVKVQHRNLVNVIASDLFVIRWLDKAASQIFREDNFSFADAVNEFETNVKQELDFVQEAKNGEEARLVIENHPTLKDRVVIPRVMSEMSSRRVLTMELVHGIPIREVVDPQQKQILAQTVIDLFAAMIFTFGKVHLDPHFGNFLVVNDGNHNNNKQSAGGPVKLALLDHGLYRTLDETFMKNHALLWKSMLIGDSNGVKQATMGMGSPQYQELLPLILTSRPVNSRAKLGERVPQDELNEIRKRAGFESGMSLSQFAEIAHDVPVDLLFVLRVMHLVKDLHLQLGGNSRDRFYGYAMAAVAFPDSIPTQTWYGWAQVISWQSIFLWNEIKLSLMKWLYYSGLQHDGTSGRFSLSGLMREKIEGAKEKPGKMFGAIKLWRRAKEIRKEQGSGGGGGGESFIKNPHE